jgi:BirA family transcriptional regulator, biotin operon repressor / biotin---[acetyl-CoA-carboxylase] ligase
MLAVWDLAALETALAGTIFAGRLHYAPITSSTNIDAVEAARTGAPHGSVYFSDEQSAGRGRGGHAWQSVPGEGLYVSILLRLPIPAHRMPMLPLAAGLATADAIHAVTGLKADVRWPNDLLIGSRKVVGILVETKTEGQHVAYAVTGIGINVHQSAFAAEFASQATSLDLETGRRISRRELLVALLKSLERESQALLGPEAETEFRSRIERSSTWLSGRRVQVHGPQACTGVTVGLDEHGFLRVRTEKGIVTVQTGGIREL